jgi:uncharacterized protein DUF4349
MRLTDEQIGVELRALRKLPSERFAAELDRQVADGFPSTRRQGARRRFEGMRPRRPLRLALAGAAVIVLGASVTVGVLENAGKSGPEGGGAILQSLPPASEATGGTRGGAASGATAGQAKSDVIAPEPVPPGGERPRAGQPRVQERSASITLATDPDRVQDVADGVVSVTDRYHGFVESSNVQAGGDRGHGSFALRIPTANLQAALADLSDLAHVVSRNEGTLDITDPFVSAGQRFNDARAQVNSLLERLAQASSASEIASLRQQLALARSELAAARAELRTIKQRADFSSVSVAISAQGSGGAWSIGDAANDAVGVLEALGGAALISLAVLIPLGGLTAALWFGLRDLRRRGRERALAKS